MLFDVWGSNTLTHWLGWAMVFVGLIVLNEVGRRTKVGAAIIFGVAPLAMTIYCAAIAFGVANGQEWALTNPTHIYQNSWFHYAKVYARWPAAGTSSPSSTSGARSARPAGSAPTRSSSWPSTS